jgi:hypothetical protein
MSIWKSAQNVSQTISCQKCITFSTGERAGQKYGLHCNFKSWALWPFLSCNSVRKIYEVYGNAHSCACELCGSLYRFYLHIWRRYLFVSFNKLAFQISKWGGVMIAFYGWALLNKKKENAATFSTSHRWSGAHLKGLTTPRDGTCGNAGPSAVHIIIRRRSKCLTLYMLWYQGDQIGRIFGLMLLQNYRSIPHIRPTLLHG